MIRRYYAGGREVSLEPESDRVAIHTGRSAQLPPAVREAVEGGDRWQRLGALNAAHEVHWRWVRGHAGNPGNERADALANRGVDQVLARR